MVLSALVGLVRGIPRLPLQDPRRQRHGALQPGGPECVRQGILATRDGLAAVDMGRTVRLSPTSRTVHRWCPFGGAAAFLVLDVRDWTARAFLAACSLARCVINIRLCCSPPN